MTMIANQQREVSGVRKKKRSVRARNLVIHAYRTQSAPADIDVRLFQELRDVCSLEPLPLDTGLSFLKCPVYYKKVSYRKLFAPAGAVTTQE